MLSSNRGQDNFRGREASRPRPRTSKCVLGDVLEAKDVLEDSTSGPYINALRYLSVLGGFEQAANIRGKRKSSESQAGEIHSKDSSTATFSITIHQPINRSTKTELIDGNALF